MLQQLIQNEIHVWNIDVDKSKSELTAHLSLLSDTEQLRAKRFKQVNYGYRWAYTHACMRQILAKYIPLSPKLMQFNQTPKGKPLLQQNAFPYLHFNLTHSNQRALLALTCCSDIGVDIEYIRELDDFDTLVSRFFSHVEQERYSQLDLAKHPQAFYNGWTRKEAVLKALGLGLCVALEDFDVVLSSITNWQLTQFRSSLVDVGEYAYCHLDLGPNYIGAIALNSTHIEPNPLPKISTFDYNSK